MQTFVVCGAGLILGISTKWIAPLLILGTVLAALFSYATLKRPEIALLGILVVTSSIIFEDQLPLLSVGIGSLHIPDTLLLGLLGLVAVRWLFEPGFKIVQTPLDRPLLIFYGVTLLSTVVALFQSSVEVEPARRAIRVFSYYLTFFVVTNLVRKRRQLNFLLNGLFLLATIVAAAMIMQYFFGASLPFLPGRVETLYTQGTAYEDVARIIPPGWSIIMVSGVAILCISVQEKFRTLPIGRFSQLGFLGIAIMITFIRAYWAAIIAVSVLLAFLLKGHGRQILLVWCAVVIFILGTTSLYGIVEPKSQVGKLVGAAYSRLATLWSPETANESSLQWRYVENEYAIRSVISHPLLGVGLGASYRPYDLRIDSRGTLWDATAYIHNGHLSILVDSGLLGYLAFAWLSIAYLVRGFRNWRNIASEWLRGGVLGFTLLYLAALIAAVTVPTFTVWGWTPVIGIIMGIQEVVLLKFRDVSSA